MRSPATSIALVAVAVTALGCGTQAPETGSMRQTSTLHSILLRPGEAPAGLEPDPEQTGPIGGLRELLPPRRAFPSLPKVPAELAGAFEEGFVAGYTAPAAGDSPPEGLTTASSSAVRFADAGAASRFLAYLQEVQVGENAPVAREPLPSAGLGDEGYGWREEVPLAESVGYAWRNGELVLTVAVSGAPDATDPAETLQLATRVDDRVP